MPFINIFTFLSNQVEIVITNGGYLLLFIFTVIEGLPLIGIVVPGHIAIIIGGFMAKIGTLNLVKVMIISVIGALIGDFIGFQIGKTYGMSFISKLRPYFFITDSYLAKTQNILSKHSGKALLVGRFTPATRALMPFLVGTTSLSHRKFWIFNIIGGILWVISSVLLGYSFGAAYHSISKYIGRTIILALLSSIIFIWGYKFINSRFHIFKKYELFTLILNLLSLWSFAIIIDKLIDNSFKLPFDVWISVLMEKFGKAHLYFVNIAEYISTIGSVYFLGLISLIVGLYFIIKRKWRSSAIVFLSVGLTVFINGILKVYFMSSRPLNSVETMITDPSFPSGHSSVAAAFFVVIAYLLAPKIQSWVKRELLIVFCVVSAILIGVSRIILNVHWFSDVVAGWSLGVFITTAVILFIRYSTSLFLKK